jgi:hypothetical protein
MISSRLFFFLFCFFAFHNRCQFEFPILLGAEVNLEIMVDANPNPPTLPGVEVDTEKTATGEKNLSLSAEQTLQHARTFPQDKTPLYICFGQNDKDNPRNFPKWKKWYISAFVAWLNFLFSFAVSFASLGFSDIAEQ